MDIVEAIEKSIAVIQRLKVLIDDVKKAPETLKDLLVQATLVQALVTELKCCRSDGLLLYEDLLQLEELRSRVQHLAEEVDAFANKVQKKDKAGKTVMRKVQWVWMKITGDDALRLLGELKDIHHAMRIIVELVIIRSQRLQHRTQAYILTAVQTADTSRQHVSNTHRSRQVSIERPSSHRLQCLEGCSCRCHGAVTRQVMPQAMRLYLGSLHVSRRLLHDLPIASVPLECNVQTCRRDKDPRNDVVWTVPTWWPSLNITLSSKKLTFYATIRSPRLVPPDAPLWHTILQADVGALQALFTSGEASVDDVNETGWTVCLPVRSHSVAPVSV
ncbi:hypothetical protein BDW22DRAFT_651004 [Trametopsis cervina]|nr:hypothetical protein BDW22DRAFT_651004 [Trametopsis cervina]